MVTGNILRDTKLTGNQMAASVQKGSYNTAYTGSALNSAAGSFGNVMDMSVQNISNADRKNLSTEKADVKEKLTSADTAGNVMRRQSKVEYVVKAASHTGSGQAVDEAVMSDSLKTLTSDIKSVVCEVLDLTDEELEKMLAENGMCISDLLMPNNLAALVAYASADGDTMKLLTDSSVSQLYSELGNRLDELLTTFSGSMNINEEELAKLLMEYDTRQNTQKESFSESSVSDLENPSMNESEVNLSSDIQNNISDEQPSIEKSFGKKELAERVEASPEPAERVEASPEPAERVEASPESAEPVEASPELAERVEVTPELAERAEAQQHTDRGSKSVKLQQGIGIQPLGEDVLEEKIEIQSDSGKQSAFSGHEGESLSGQFVEALIKNVDNSLNTNNVFNGYAVDAEDVVRQLIDSIKVNVNSQTSEMELQLSPESLGKVNLLVEAKNGIITAQLTTQNEAVKTIIENQLVSLKENFAQQGLKVEAVEVMVESHGFETGKNLEGRSSGNSSGEERKSTRHLTLEEIDTRLSEQESISEEDLLAAEMMRATGGSVDYTA